MAIGFFACLAPGAAAGQPAEAHLPIVSLVLPSAIAPENTAIFYFLIGPFGGYGDFVRTEKERQSYDIAASVDGKPATKIKIIVYMPGCEIVSLDIPLQSEGIEQRPTCKPLPSIPLSGQISPASILDGPPSEVEVVVAGRWSDRFFGTSDGPAAAILIATVTPDKSGHFEVSVPDFARQAELADSVLNFRLLQRDKHNLVAFLNLDEPDNHLPALTVRPYYPADLHFKAQKP